MMSSACAEGETRPAIECGWERCEDDEWVPLNGRVTETCNQHDDDCDLIIDEDPTANNQSDCCDESQCYLRHVCEAGACTPLGDRDCREPGDCASDYYCYIDWCLEPFPEGALTQPLGCSMPYQALTPGSYRVGGLNASRIFSAPGCGDRDLNDSALERETQNGYEVTFELYVPSAGQVELSGRVRHPTTDLPVTVTLYPNCDPALAPVGCGFSGIQGLTFGGSSASFEASLNWSAPEAMTVIAVVDVVYGEQRRRALPLNELDFTLTYEFTSR